MANQQLSDKLAQQQNDQKSLRPEMRGTLANEEDPRERAARRAKEVREHIGSMDEGTDDFYAPTPPAGWHYEWKRKTVIGQEDPAYQVHLARMGWEPVPCSRHPEMMPSGNNFRVIERKGMILMERPQELVEEARKIEANKAKRQVRDKEAQLAGTPEGTFARDDERVKPKIRKGYEPMPVPND